MSELIDTGGPAFPQVPDNEYCQLGNTMQGMTLRAYIATHALQGILARTGLIRIEAVISESIDHADELIKQLLKRRAQ